MNIPADLLVKYNQPVPRYTSYPTVPFWKEGFEPEAWGNLLAKQFRECDAGEGISLYIHLPFCESLCTYCGCNKKITGQHSVEEGYIATILKEWDLYLNLMRTKPIIRELHLGGGTPTFFSPENLTDLLSRLLAKATLHHEHEFSFEGHPNNTTQEHLKALYNLGFRRVSFGVQDHNPEVQRIINRIQPLENVARAIREAREIGYSSVNLDLIYGLPLQTVESMKTTIEQTIALRPDRIAFYSYAHVPWTSRAQRLFDEQDLPSVAMKMQLYLLSKKMFLNAGYFDIGMDHYALEHDDLFVSKKEGFLHRNFMGYTLHRTNILIGLGVSAISDAGMGYAQNNKTLHDYTEAVENGQLAVNKGLFLTEEDVHFRKYILAISCRGNTFFRKEDLPLIKELAYPMLEELQKDGLLNYTEKGLVVTDLGNHFIRNICYPFDLHVHRKKTVPALPIFSKAI
ncbi:MAG: oxygen-independent coproporphyrinogen oxidase [Bacteroidota bacterium]|jgi:oxygen-independent coproporphyrinogen-3 oxidase